MRKLNSFSYDSSFVESGKRTWLLTVEIYIRLLFVVWWYLINYCRCTRHFVGIWPRSTNNPVNYVLHRNYKRIHANVATSAFNTFRIRKPDTHDYATKLITKLKTIFENSLLAPPHSADWNIRRNICKLFSPLLCLQLANHSIFLHANGSVFAWTNH